jgi:hypothetical protein
MAAPTSTAAMMSKSSAYGWGTFVDTIPRRDAKIIRRRIAGLPSIADLLLFLIRGGSHPWCHLLILKNGLSITI